MDAVRSPVRLGSLIRVSPYFDYYFLAGRPHWFCKAPTRWRVKRYFGIPVPYPTSLYTAFKFGVIDTTAFELSAFDSLRPHLEDYLPRQMQRTRTDEGRTVLCAEWPMNFDGTPAEIMCLHGPIRNASFWDHVDRIKTTIREQDLTLLGVFSGDSAAVLVHKETAQDWKPVILDVLKFGRRFYYYQFWMHWPAQFRRKFERGLAEFEQRYRLPIPPH